MTDTERWVNGVCGLIVATGAVRLYKDLYKDLRASLPCADACRLIEGGLQATRQSGARRYAPDWRLTGSRRARAIAALNRLARWAKRLLEVCCVRCGARYTADGLAAGVCSVCATEDFKRGL